MRDAVVDIEIGELYAAHGGWLCDWLRRRTRCPERASDLAHDTFCRLLERGRSALPLEPRPFLATVARRLLVDDIRRREVERAYLDVCAAQAGDADLLTPERIAEATQLLAGILQLLWELPDLTRRAFLLRRLEGQGHAEIAAVLGVSERTVKRHIAAAYAHCYALAYPER
ncbi:sigma-70 family RNA polymerase sigma factor [Rhodospirillum centenum]|uniref:RNA polymerase sigma-70 factor ECF family protein n=1 Tax=Rhodospirillum centenum (strain ATCC 51521 / SW) TaxID=414684 RepID=B6IXY1_RHOCS|nr:sigma-70 family RNA polymerase sigma factor [Rhodospirillum centenum]ACJ01155.1 RNA polymerase sigma-70 factor; ECF family protein [Rhodospirillum centenum SW]